MPKQKVNRKKGIHLHKTEPTLSVKKSKISTIYGPPGKPEYYWILITKNGKTICRSSETYKTKRAAVKSIGVAAEIFINKGYYFDHTTGGVGVDEVDF